MINQTVLVGRLVSDPEIIELEDGNKVSNITLAVSRPYKNSEGVYETDFIKCTLWKGVAENTAEYCKKGDMIAIRGRLQTNSYENKETGQKVNELKVVAERLTFLSSRQHSHSKNEQEMAR